jgi:hypothetical protein
MSHRMAARPEILFVYNVDLTLFALVSDFVHRLTAPETYPCRLCDLTYDRFTMKREWNRFIESLPIHARFELRDRFRRKFPAYADVPLPAVFRSEGAEGLSVLLSADQLNRVRTLGELKELVLPAVRPRPRPRSRSRSRSRSA